jgi:hypothetical protein
MKRNRDIYNFVEGNKLKSVLLALEFYKWTQQVYVAANFTGLLLLKYTSRKPISQGSEHIKLCFSQCTLLNCYY